MKYTFFIFEFGWKNPIRKVVVQDQDSFCSCIILGVQDSFTNNLNFTYSYSYCECDTRLKIRYLL